MVKTKKTLLSHYYGVLYHSLQKNKRHSQKDNYVLSVYILFIEEVQYEFLILRILIGSVSQFFEDDGGLGVMDISVYFSIRDMQEARDYYAHPILGAHLREITQAVLETACSDPMVVFGDPDAYKLRSCMTLFKHAAPDDPLFQAVLDRCCMGEEDPRTLARI